MSSFTPPPAALKGRTISLTLLGPWRALLNGAVLPPLPTRHTRVLCARLALAHPLPVRGPGRPLQTEAPLPPLPTRHTRVLCARLALAHPLPVTRGELRADLFPDLDAEAAAQHLRTTLYYLRRALGDAVWSQAD